jgi:hypothetical protein
MSSKVFGPAGGFGAGFAAAAAAGGGIPPTPESFDGGAGAMTGRR